MSVNCRTTINVTATGVDFPDAYICKDKKVTWIANGHISSVGFRNGVCPFEGQGACKEIDTQQPTSGGPIKYTTTTVIYDYVFVITVNYLIRRSSAGVSLSNENLQFLHNETVGHVPRRCLPVVG